MDISLGNDKQTESSHPAIPQMIITAAEDASDDTEDNRTECTLVLIPPEAKDTGQQKQASSRDQPSNGCEESPPAESASPPAEPAASHSVVQRPLIIEIEQKIRTDPSQNDSSRCPEPPPPPPPIVCPPLVIHATTSVLSTTQRPLVFDGSSSKTEVEAAESGPRIEYTSVCQDDIHHDRVEYQTTDSCDVPNEPNTNVTEDESAQIKKDGHHGVKKFFDSFLGSDSTDPAVAVKNETSPSSESDASKGGKTGIRKFFQSSSKSESDVRDKKELQQSGELVKVPPKKEGLEGMKSFFSFKHEPSGEKSTNSELDVSKVSEKGGKAKKVPKSEGKARSEPPQVPDKKVTKEHRKSFFSFKHDVSETDKSVPKLAQPELSQDATNKTTNYFHTPKLDLESEDKSNLSQPAEHSKPASSSFKEAKESIKTFFAFKHEQSDTKGDAVEPVPSELTKTIESSESQLLERPKSPTSPFKDAKESIKTFFSFKHEQNDPIPAPSEPLSIDSSKSSEISEFHSPERPKTPSSPIKDAKESIKTFFSLKHDQSDQKPTDSASLQIDSNKSSHVPESHSVEQSKTPSSPIRDAKESIKTFFSVKHDQTDPKTPLSESLHVSSVKSTESSESQPAERPKTPSSPIKDAKETIKTFFTKHEQNDQKKTVAEPPLSDAGKVGSSELSGKKDDSTDKIKKFFHISKTEPRKDTADLSQSQELSKSDDQKKTVSEPPLSDAGKVGSSELSGKKDDSTDKIKKFFHISKTEPRKDTTDLSQSQEPSKSDAPSVRETKESKKNVISLGHGDLNENASFESVDVSAAKKEEKESSSFAKDAKQNVKSFFGSFKNVPSDKKVCRKSASHPDFGQDIDIVSNSVEEPPHKESSSLAKDAKQNIKGFFGSFKHDTTEHKGKMSTSAKSISHPDITITDFSSEKPATLRQEPSKEIPGEIERSVNVGISEPSCSVSPTEEKKSSFVKDTRQNIKSFFDGLKTADTDSSKNKNSSLKKKLSEPDLSKSSYDEPTLKSSKHPLKRLFSNKDKTSADLNQATPAKSAKSVRIDPTPTYSNGIENIDDDFHLAQLSEQEVSKVKEIDNKSSVAVTGKSSDQKSNDKKKTSEIRKDDIGESGKEKAAKEKKSKGIRRSLSDRVSREVVAENFKGFFDSLGSKSTAKVGNSSKNSEHIYDTVEVRPEADLPSHPFHSESADKSNQSSDSKRDNQGVKTLFGSFHSKPQPKLLVSRETETDKASSDKIDKTIVAKKACDKAKELKSTKETTVVYNEESVNKSPDTPDENKQNKSVFNSISENIIALKGKLSKEKRKSNIEEPGADENAVETPKILEKSAVLPEHNKENVDAKKSPESPVRIPEKQNQKMTSDRGSVKESKGKQISPAAPGSLYDTCCMKISLLLKDKAVNIVTERAKCPPPKPPKPSAETVAKARAAAVSRRMAEAQKLSRSVGDIVPIGVDGMRFADDETESSCDYKDVDNFDYIMDYELINRYKIDSSDVPSVCSGMSSYYTAETMTLRSFSDATMENVSLNGDFKSASDIGRTIPLKDDYQNIQVNGTLTKTPGVKKIPPPIPPKPKIPYVPKAVVEGKISQSINGLSLSPRLQNKFAKDLAATKKRPLLVSGTTEADYSSLPLPKRTAPKKPLRYFNTVLKNESLKNVSDQSSLTSKKLSTSPARPSRENISKSETNDVEKRTKSPPRPPPPAIAKKPTPQRPPPPAKPIKVPTVDEGKSSSAVESPTEIIEFVESSEKKENVTSNDYPKEMQSPGNIEKVVKIEMPPVSSQMELNVTDQIISSEQSQSVSACKENSLLNDSVILNTDDSVNNNTEVDRSITFECPKRPPRGRRIRSRTVEITPPEKEEDRLKRSQSLSEIDVQKRVALLSVEKKDPLYSSVKKEKKSSGEKRTDSPNQEVSSRPLPAPPPPPRKFRSLERKAKEKRTVSPDSEASSEMTVASQISECEEAKPPTRRKTEKQRFFSLHSEERNKLDSLDSVKRASSVPTRPDRKHKPIARFDVNANISNLNDSPNVSSPSIPETDSEYLSIRSKSETPNPPSKDDTDSRKLSRTSWYDESEILEYSWEIVQMNSEILESVQGPLIPARRKDKKKPRQTSTFYVNVDEQKTTSYVSSKEREHRVDNIEQPANKETGQREDREDQHTEHNKHELVDKETSPLPLDCSEKSVQTSLETLSQGIVSHDESEDTDDLLDLAQTLQNELKTIINRHKQPNDSPEDTPSPSPSETSVPGVFRRPKSSSVRSSTSEVWPMTSSDESEVEKQGEEVTLTDLAVKRRNKKIFYIAQEIMTSEEVFVDALRLLNVDFKSAVEAASKQKNINVVPDEILNQILNHLPQLQHLNENMLMELKDRIDNWEKLEKIADIIVKMGPFLKLYSWYIHDFESNSALLEDSKRKYPLFAQVVKEFEASSRCKLLTVQHYMLKPIQRIPQYRLLLQEYLHHLPEEHPDYKDTQQALQIVTEVANHANDCMKQGDNAQKLISIQNSIMGHKEIVRPGRVFVKEGELMKLSRKGMQPRWFVLFNDMLLYLTPVQPGLYRVNHELQLAGMKVAIPIQQDYQNEFSIISVTRSFTLAARSPEERQEWIVVLTKAIEENASKRSTFTNTRLQQKASGSSEEEGGRSGSFVLGQKAPVWIPDARVTMCQLCTSHFTVTFRRHHCRACGKVVCSICSSHRISLPYLGNRIARVCDECYNHLGQGSSVGTESGETDSEGHQVVQRLHSRTVVKKAKRSLPSVLKEVCANDQGSDMSGHLYKKVGRGWKRDWFVLKKKVLYEYKASEDVAALRSTPLLGYNFETFSEPFEGVEASLLFQLTHPGQSPMVFYADNPATLERWTSVLKAATVLE